jgi:hypothetical protein
MCLKKSGEKNCFIQTGDEITEITGLDGMLQLSGQTH